MHADTRSGEPGNEALYVCAPNRLFGLKNAHYTLYLYYISHNIFLKEDSHNGNVIAFQVFPLLSGQSL